VLMSGVIGMMGRWVMVVGRAVQRRKQGVVFGEWRRDKEM
jgi:hypothetical protein